MSVTGVSRMFDRLVSSIILDLTTMPSLLCPYNTPCPWYILTHSSLVTPQLSHTMQIMSYLAVSTCMLILCLHSCIKSFLWTNIWCPLLISGLCCYYNSLFLTTFFHCSKFLSCFGTGTGIQSSIPLSAYLV